MSMHEGPYDSVMRVDVAFYSPSASTWWVGVSVQLAVVMQGEASLLWVCPELDILLL